MTRQVGALNDRYLSRRPLGESRVLFEIGLRSLERDGLIEKRLPSPV